MQSGKCNYMFMAGHCRIVGLKPREQEPQNCPRYISDGTSRKTRAVGRDWHTEAEKLYHAGYTDHEIADAVGVSYSSVQNWRRRTLNVDPNPDRGKSSFSWEWARDLYLAGLNDREIAEKLGCCVSSVWRWRTKYELFHNGTVGNRKKGTDCHTSAAAQQSFECRAARQDVRNDGEGGNLDEAQGTGEPVQ